MSYTKALNELHRIQSSTQCCLNSHSQPQGTTEATTPCEYDRDNIIIIIIIITPTCNSCELCSDTQTVHIYLRYTYQTFNMLLHVQLEEVNIIIAIPNPSPLQQVCTIQLCPQRLSTTNTDRFCFDFGRLQVIVPKSIVIGGGGGRLQYG